MNADEKRFNQIKERLSYARAHRPEFICSHRWENGSSFEVWEDNTSFLEHAYKDIEWLIRQWEASNKDARKG